MDVRVKLTKKMIFEAFLSILKNKPIAKITVKEICAAADINRTTFYKYYKDTYDLLEQIEDELIDNLQANLEHVDKSSLSDIFTIILTDISEKRELYVTLFSMKIIRKYYLSISPGFLKISRNGCITS